MVSLPSTTSLQRLVLAFFALEVRSPFWTEFSNAKWNKFIETGAAIFARLRAGIIFIFTRVSCECQWRQKQGDVVIFRAFFVFTRPITHAQFVNCRACALKNRKPKKWHPVFDYPRVRGISIPLTVNARGLWGRDCHAKGIMSMRNPVTWRIIILVTWRKKVGFEAFSNANCACSTRWNFFKIGTFVGFLCFSDILK